MVTEGLKGQEREGQGRRRGLVTYEGDVHHTTIFCPLQVPHSLAVTEPASAAASTAGASAALRCVLERSRRLCLRLYEKELLTDTTALEGAAKWVMGDGELGVGVLNRKRCNQGAVPAPLREGAADRHHSA